MSPKRVNQCLVPVALLIVVYLGYRALYTFSLDSMWFAVLFYLAELHGAFVFFLFCFETWYPQHPEP
ncbi:MAG: hypothetical protein IIA66_07795, partial [Planctomycetes bacterium]|nr:hypothetical protein [Planctomycetota bacterium]